MPNGYGRGIGYRRCMGSGRDLGLGRGVGSGRGIGLGFRGSSPPRPYTGLGRGGLPRCGYYYGNTVSPVQMPMGNTRPNYPNKYAPTTKEEEISRLDDQAQAIKEELDNIETRLHDLEGEK